MRFAAFVGHQNHVRIYDKPRWDEWLEKHVAQRIEVELRDEAKVRSNRQNRFFHGPVLEELARVWHADGWRRSHDDGSSSALPRWMVRARALALFCPHDFIKDPDGHATAVRQSTADLSVKEFTAMLEEVAEYLTHKEGERGILPSPEEWSE